MKRLLRRATGGDPWHVTAVALAPDPSRAAGFSCLSPTGHHGELAGTRAAGFDGLLIGLVIGQCR